MRLAILLVLFTVFGALLINRHQPQPPTPISIQQHATHRLGFIRKGQDVGFCTGTAIGPHAILTATHCRHDISEIHLDLSTKTYNIMKVLTDDRDHDIYLIDGSPLDYLVEYKVREALVGEPVFLYGNGGAQYPSRKLEGRTIDFEDPSDVDARQGEAVFSLPVIPGDSGSAVFASDGSIVAVTTYAFGKDTPWYQFWVNERDSFSVDFAPNFSPEQIAYATSYVPAPGELPPAPVLTPAKSLLDFFR